MSLMLVLGILIAAQFRTRRQSGRASLFQDEQVSLLSELSDANLALGSEVRALQAKLAGYEGQDRGGRLEDLVAELNRVKVHNGLIGVSGPGIEVALDGPLNALDLQDMINELRNAGAEAISLNGQRLIVGSVVVARSQGGLVVDGLELERPYRFVAIGDPDGLQTALLRSGGLVALLRQNYPTLRVTSVQHNSVVLGVHPAVAPLEHVRAIN